MRLVLPLVLMLVLLTAFVAACHAAPPAPVQPFGKEYIPYQFHEMLYFNNREADLEHHAFVRGKWMYCTLTDLFRHIGGNIVWGPRDSFVEVERKGKKVRFIPGSETIVVDGHTQYLSRPTFRRDRLLYVPVRSTCDLFDCKTGWDPSTLRAYVNFAE